MQWFGSSAVIQVGDENDAGVSVNCKRYHSQYVTSGEDLSSWNNTINFQYFCLK